MTRIGRRLALALCVGLLLGAAMPATPAAAAPIDDQRAEAQRLEAAIHDTATESAALYEQIKFAQDQAAAADEKVADAEAAIDTARAEVQRVTTLVRQRAVTMYKRSGDTGLEGIDANVTDSASRSSYADATSAKDNGLLDKLARAKEQLSEERQDAASARDEAQTRAETLEQQVASFDALQQEQEQLLAQVNGEIGRLVAEEHAMRVAAEAPRTIVTGPTEVTGPGSPTRPVVAGLPEVVAPPGSGSAEPVLPPSGADAVVAYVQAQLGKPYCYAGAGPGCFDCSGLTMQAWAQVGVYMAHNSEAQYAAFTKVPMNALLPGDIVWNPGHVGIYVGNGAVIHAPHEGDVVRYISVDYFQAAVRPS
jgi:cell wall-associated NlpC family hydrolase